MPQSSSKPARAAKGRRSNENAAETRDRIVRAALAAFSEMGFGAASLREIGERADVSQQLITHHFETKLGLWKAVVDHTFGELRASFVGRARELEGVSLPERMRLLIKEFLVFSAEHPEFARFMMHEGASKGPRLEWLVERHVRPIYKTIESRIEEAQGRGLMPMGDPFQIVYLLIGSTAMFSQAAEFELLVGRDVRSTEVVDARADLVLRLLLPGVPLADEE